MLGAARLFEAIPHAWSVLPGEAAFVRKIRAISPAVPRRRSDRTQSLRSGAAQSRCAREVSPPEQTPASPYSFSTIAGHATKIHAAAQSSSAVAEALAGRANFLKPLPAANHLLGSNYNDSALVFQKTRHFREMKSNQQGEHELFLHSSLSSVLEA